MKEQPHICPLCGRAYDEPPALSRADNQTDICPRCGMMEALAAMPRRSPGTAPPGLKMAGQKGMTAA